MPRNARKISENGIYHIYALGEPPKTLTKESNDKAELLAILKAAKELFDFSLYAYVVTKNELHLVLKESAPLEISEIMKFVLSTYTNYYNSKYSLKGKLIHDRFVSVPIDTNEDLKAKIRYLHQLPVREKECPNVFTYRFSSYNDYFNSSSYTDTATVLALFSDNAAMQKTQFKIYHAMAELKDYKRNTRIKYSEEELREILFNTLGLTEEELLQKTPSEKLEAAKTMRKKTSLSLRQIESCCHVSRSLISAAKPEKLI